MVFPSLMVALAAYCMAPVPYVQEKIYKAVHTVAQKVMWDVVQILYKYKKDQGKGTTLKEISRFSDPKWKKAFGKHDSECLSIQIGNFDPRCDITFLHQVITEIFYDAFLKLDETCQKMIVWIKNLRNKAKKNFEGTTVESDLRVKLEYIYNNVGQTFGEDLSDNIENMKLELDDIFSSNLIDHNVGNFDNDLENLNSEKKSKMMGEGREEFKTYYSKLKILNPCSSLDEEKFGHFTVDKIFTDLIIKDKTDILAKIVINGILTAEKFYSSKSVTPSVLVIQGLAGSGKTSLCRFFLYEWCIKGIDILKLADFDLVILIEVRTAKSKTLEDHLRQKVLCRTMKQFPDDGMPLLKTMQILFVVDGFDDDPRTAKSIIENILNEFQDLKESGKLLNDSRIMITTRPEFKIDISKVLSKIGYGHLDLNVKGFDKTKVKKFAEKVFDRYDAETQKLEEFIAYLDGRGRILNKHLELPLTTALLIFLWLDDPERVNQVTTSTQLFKEVFDLCMERLKDKISSESHQLKNKLDRKLEDIFTFLGEIAWDMLQKNEVTLSTETCELLKKKCKPLKEETAVKIMSSFLMCEPEIDDSSHIISFLHKTQMEYMAAVFLLSKVKEGKSLELIFENEEGQKIDTRGYLNVVIFLVGHLNIENKLKKEIKSVFNIVNEAKIEKDNYAFWWNLLSECCKRNEITYDPIVGKGISERLPKSWSLDSSNVTEALCLLNYTIVTPERLVINTPLKEDPNDISGFGEIMKELSSNSNIQSRYKHKSLEIELHFPFNFQEVDSSSSDLFLKTLHPWANINFFEGQMEDFIFHEETLKNCKNFYVKVKTTTALKCVSKSLSMIKAPRKVHVSLEFSEMYEESEISQIKFAKPCNFTITFKNKFEAKIAWIEKVVNRITNGEYCQELIVHNCVAGTAELQKHLPLLKVSDKVQIDQPEDMEDAHEKKLKDKVRFKIDWM